MSSTHYGTNAPEAVKLWSRKLAREAYANTWVKKLIGTSDNSIIQLKKDLKKSEGDRVRCILRMQPDDRGVKGDATLEGKEGKMTTFTNDLLVDQIRHAFRSGGKMSEQRIPFNVRDEHMQILRDWFATRMDRWAFTQLCGFTGGTVTDRGETFDGSDDIYTGHNAALAPDSTAHFRADTNGAVHTFTGAASDEDITTTDVMRLEYLDHLKVEAETRAPLIRPVNFQGEKLYVVIIDPIQARDLRTSTETGQWLDIQKAALAGGDGKANPIFSGAMGMYNNMVIHVSNRITPGVHSSTGAVISTVRRALFLGAQAGMLAFGKGHSFENYDWHEELFDHGNQLSVSGACIAGLKKSRFNSRDFGTLVLSTYAA